MNETLDLAIDSTYANNTDAYQLDVETAAVSGVSKITGVNWGTTESFTGFTHSGHTLTWKVGGQSVGTLTASDFTPAINGVDYSARYSDYTAWVDQALDATSNPTFAGLTATELTVDEWFNVTSSNLNFDDAYVYLNSDYKTAANQTTGLIFNYYPTATTDTIAGDVTAGVDGVSLPTITTAGSGTFSAADMIRIVFTSADGDASQNVDDIYEVAGHSGQTLTLKGPSHAPTVSTFTRGTLVSESTVVGTITKLSIAMLAADTNGLRYSSSQSASTLISGLTALPAGVTTGTAGSQSISTSTIVEAIDAIGVAGPFSLADGTIDGQFKALYNRYAHYPTRVATNRGHLLLDVMNYVELAWLTKPSTNGVIDDYSEWFVLSSDRDAVWLPYTESAIYLDNGIATTNALHCSAIAADGCTFAVGSAADDTVWIYARQSNGTFAEQEAITDTGDFGTSVALSADGNTLAVGAPTANINGVVSIYTRSGTAWTLQQGIDPDGATGTPAFGTSVSLDATGDTLCAGGPSNNSAAGATWFYTRSAGVWSIFGTAAVGTGATGAAQQGNAVHITPDAQYATVVGPANNSAAGAIWIFKRGTSSYSQLVGPLVASGTGTVGLVQSKLSDDASVLAAVGATDSTGVGAAFVFNWTGATYTQSSYVTMFDTTGAAGINSLDMNSDGSLIAIGGPSDDTNVGGVWLLRKIDDAYIQYGDKLFGDGVGFNGTNRYGRSIAMDRTGRTMLVGALTNTAKGCIVLVE